MSARTQTKHTPGPWDFDGNASEGYTLRAAGRSLAVIHRPLHQDAAEHHANASLIAAAPELLAIAEKAEEFFSDPGAFTPTTGKRFCALIQAAIAKAKGADPVEWDPDFQVKEAT